MRPRQCIGVDWSGARHAAQAAAHIRVAVVREGRLSAVHAGLTREAATDLVVQAACEEPETVIGLDFCFSVPAWYAEERGWRSVGEVWRWADAWVRGGAAAGSLGEPFWGPGLRPSPRLEPERALRVGEQEVSRAGARPRSVFQLRGAGSVGAQSLHGMPTLQRLCDAGVAIWPFDPPRLPVAVEVFPRLLARLLCPGPGRPSGAEFRRRVVSALPAAAYGRFRERLMVDQDSFDAAVTAWSLHVHADAIAALPAARDAREALEGRIFAPETT